VDRDGVLNRDRDDYVKDLTELEIFPWTPAAIVRANRAGYEVAVVSNQQGVGLGLVTREHLDEITDAIRRTVLEAGGTIAAFLYCTHLASEGCDCRKPKPGMLKELQREFGFSMDEAYFVGDSQSDLKAARAAGCGSVLVLSGHTKAEDLPGLPHQPDHVCAHLGEAVDWIVSRDRP
jgi:D-glycero-D-manno-heptose 1,7-bisphosphate phosphatase